MHSDDGTIKPMNDYSFEYLQKRMNGNTPEFVIVYENADFITMEHLTGEHRGSIEIESSDTKTHYEQSKFRIYDLLGTFSSKEILEGNNQYEGAKGKFLVDAERETSIYTTPLYLILHLKRFAKNESAYYRRNDHEKVEDFVDFPIQGLDISDYVDSPSDKESSVYDLYGVVHHEGSMNFGHYWATCKNPETGRWYRFDDSHVREIDGRIYGEEDIVSRTAYVLFYKRRAENSGIENHKDIDEESKSSMII